MLAYRSRKIVFMLIQRRQRNQSGNNTFVSFVAYCMHAW